MRLTRPSLALLSVIAFLALAPVCPAQIAPVSSTTSTPIPGAGHDYIDGGVETVNPANGSISIRIPVSMPSGRGITLPFSFAYDSNGVNYLSSYGLNDQWFTTTSVVTQAGWSNTIPVVSDTQISWKTLVDGGPTQINCSALLNFVFQGPHGDRHNLNLTNWTSNSTQCAINTADWPNGFDGLVVTQGGEGPISASIPASFSPSTGATVTDADGTVYGFPTGFKTWIANSVTDRNGNTININSISPAINFVDTTGRTVLQDSGFAISPETVTVSGLGAPYTLTWITLATPSFPTAITTPITNVSACSGPSHSAWDSTQNHAVSALTLPNGKSFSFTYDPVYGLVNKITYPGGGYVRYVWGMNSQAEYGFFAANLANQCDMLYAVPAITDRYVSFDGTTEVLHQHFAYSTTWPSVATFWTSKQTTVTTYDLVRNTNFQTIYTYSGLDADIPPNSFPPTQKIQVESSIAYYDTNTSLLKTVSKTWANPRLLTSQQTTFPNGQASKTTWTYNSNEMQTEQDDYDFGNPAPPSSPLRKTATSYATSTTMAASHVINKPSSIVVYDGASNRVAETDYTYDSPVGSATSGIVQHGAGCNCGNLTQQSQWVNTSGTTLSTTYTNDDTGQRLSATDPRGGQTTYSYTDSFSSGTPPGATNAYLTSVTRPQTNGINHVEKYAYAYASGEVTSFIDQNNHTTTYKYVDNFARLTETDFPDGGKTTRAYNDAAYNPSTPSPSVTTTKTINSSTNLVTITAYDGLGHIVRKELTSDPQGMVLADTTYDGLGRASTLSNPYRSTSDATYGITTTQYDALDRAAKLIPPDGTSSTNNVSTVYTGSWTTVTDQAGKQRRSLTDALGRLIEVDEPTGGSPATSGSGSATLAGSEQSISGASATSGTGSATVNGTEQSKAGTAATSGNGSVTISGTEQSVVLQKCTRWLAGGDCQIWANYTQYDTGTVSITVNSFSKSTSYGSTSTSSTIASSLASAFNGDSTSPVTATASGSTVTLTAKVSGTISNYSLSATSATTDPTDFNGPSFSATASGLTLTGGTNATPTVYDSGSAWVTVNGFQAAASYGQGSTSATVASAIANIFNTNTSSPVTASVSGATVNLVAKTTGASTNYSLSSGSSGTFSPSSFSVSVSGSWLTGGYNAGTTTYDTGTVSVTVNGIQFSATYGQSSTTSTLASALASSINGNSAAPVSAIVSGSTINLTAKQPGAAGNYSLSFDFKTSQPTKFASPSFTVSDSGSTLTGGTDANPGSLATPAVTLYAYDTLGNLLCAVQKGTDTTAFTTCAAAPTTWRPRSFTYNSLSQLLTANNPESGANAYTYDANGNMLTKTDARSITTTYAYDALNRLTGKTYSNTDPAVSYTYDQPSCLGQAACSNIGNRTGMTDAAGSEAGSYDAMGRMLTDQRTTNSVTKSTSYSYNFDGSIATLTYPSGRTVTYTQNSASQPVSAIDVTNSINYATAAGYAPQGALASLTLGSSGSFGGIQLNNSYNPRLQPNEIKAWSTAGVALDLTYSFADASGLNNGHVTAITNNLDTTRSQTFGYDQLNRITAAQTISTYATSPAHCWGEAYSADAWGNLQSISATTNSQYTGCSQESGFSKTADTKNHFSDFSYDLSGNTASDGTYSYIWNGESQLKSTSGVNYLYDGDGQRVYKSSGKLYWYGAGGEILAETDGSGNTTAEYIFFGGKRISMLPASGTPLYYVEDMLGTSRVITSNTGVVCYDADFYPYGGEHSYTNTCPQNYKFEGKERDSETGNDDFGARYYSNRFGRWLSADWSAVPVPVPYANLSNPQTLNLYAMVADDPETFADLDGHDGIPAVPSCRGKNSTDAACGPQSNVSIAARQAVEIARSALNNPDFALRLPMRIAGDPQQPGTPAQSGINPNYTFDHVLKKASDFSAGAGDCLTGRCLFLGTSLTEKARQLNSADSVVDKESGAYLGGKVTGAVVGTGIASLAVANAAVGLESKVAIHGAHHAFEWLGGARLAHIQTTLWLAGVKGSDINFRIPLPWK